MEQVPVIRPGGEYQSRDRQELSGVDGSLLATVSQTPPMLVGRVLRSMCHDEYRSDKERLEVLALAGRLFAEATLEGESPEEYRRLHALATGVPISVSGMALRSLPEHLDRLPDTLDAQRPVAMAPAGTVGCKGRWLPRGRVLGVLAPSNHPMTHLGWLQAIAFGYRVAVRPGSRDPFTPRRLGRALRQAGLPDDWLAVLPGPHATAEALLRDTDLGLLYGDESTVAPYRGQTRYLVRGPGRTKAILTGKSLPTEEMYEYLVESIAGDAGVRCTNVSAVLVEGDHRAVAEELARRLSKLAALSVLDERAALPTRPLAAAAAIRRALESISQGDAVEVTAAVSEGPFVELDDGQTVLRPAVFSVQPDHPGLRAELPFPCVWVAPWRREEGVAPLRDSLAVLVLGEGGAVVDELLSEPTVRTVVLGRDGRWWSDPLVPHDGYLGHFLMEARGYVEADGAR